MNDIIAQVIAIIGYGNDYLQVGNLLYDFDSNCIFQYCIYNHRTTKTNQKYPSVNL